MTSTGTTTGASPGRVLAVTSLGVFIVFLDTTIVNVAFDTIAGDLGTSTRGLAWVLNAYALVFAALLVPAGRLADQYGRRRLFLAGLLGFALTSAACGLAPSTGVLIGARALQAVFAALVVPTSLALVLPEFPPEQRSAAIGTWGAMGALAAASGPTLGALIIEAASWRWVFLVNVPICLLAGALGVGALREGRDPDARGLPDPLGVLLVIAAPGLAALAIVQGPVWGWGSARVLGCLAGGAVLLVLFVLRTRVTATAAATDTARRLQPVVDLALFRVRSYAFANAGTLLYSLAFFALTLSNIIFLQQVWHWSVLRTALAVTPSPLTAAAVAPFSGRLADRYGHRVVLVPGALVFAAGVALYAVSTGTRPAYLSAWLPAALLAGAGVGLTLPTLGSAAASTLPPARFGVGSAVNSSFRQLGAVLGVSVFVAVLGTPTRLTALAAFHRVWVVIAAVAVAAALLCLGVRTRATSAGGPAAAPARELGVAATEPAPALG